MTPARSLEHRVVILIATGVVLTSVTLGVIGGIAFGRQRAHLATSHQALVHSMALQIDLELTQLFGVLQTVAAQARLAMVEGTPIPRDALRRPFIETRIADAVFVIDRQGRELAHEGALGAPSPEALSSVLDAATTRGTATSEAHRRAAPAGRVVHRHQRSAGNAHRRRVWQHPVGRPTRRGVLRPAAPVFHCAGRRHRPDRAVARRFGRSGVAERRDARGGQRVTSECPVAGQPARARRHGESPGTGAAGLRDHDRGARGPGVGRGPQRAHPPRPAHRARPAVGQRRPLAVRPRHRRRRNRPSWQCVRAHAAGARAVDAGAGREQRTARGPCGRPHGCPRARERGARVT